MNRVKLGVFSLSAASETGEDQAYLAWHQMDHMPEQYQIPGLVNAQRWVSTAACRAARADGTERLADVEHVVCYLMGDPVEQSLEDFFELGRRLSGLGRLPVLLPARLLTGQHLLESRASPGALVSAEVVPFRPNRGVYLVVEEVTEPGAALEAHVRWRHTDLLPEVVEVPGVAGVWTFATTGRYRHDAFSDGRLRVTVCYLDDDPVTVARALAPLWRRAWAGAPLCPLLSAPFESIAVADWRRFARGSADVPADVPGGGPSDVPGDGPPGVPADVPGGVHRRGGGGR